MSRAERMALERLRVSLHGMGALWSQIGDLARELDLEASENPQAAVALVHLVAKVRAVELDVDEAAEHLERLERDDQAEQVRQ